jgi:hypothetical protein
VDSPAALADAPLPPSEGAHRQRPAPRAAPRAIGRLADGPRASVGRSLPALAALDCAPLRMVEEAWVAPFHAMPG